MSMKAWSLVILMSIFCCLGGCGKKSSNTKPELRIATSAMYPPFEYSEYGELKGFDIELGRLIARELGREATFIDTQFSAVLLSVQDNQADAAIATITITDERKQNFDFSQPYYFVGMAALYKTGNAISTPADLEHKKIGCQLGTTMEIWLKKNTKNTQITAMDENGQLIAALKTGIVDGVLLDGEQARVFAKENPGLSYKIIAKADDGYGIVVAKGSPLLAPINKALQKLEANGEMTALKKKWLGEGQ
jgi:polar amino acid transport system substrate-binding protein